jgi:AcrR family transcriptional regulator
VPKIVDSEARRAELSEALWRVLARAGIEGVTIRSVAAEAGWSRGIVEHYFKTKQEMVLYACQLACRRGLAKVASHHRELHGRAALRAVLLHDLALYGERRQAAGIWFGLLSAAAHESALGAEMIRFDAEVRLILAEIIAEMIARGEASTDLNPEAEARSILSFNLGVNLSVMMQPELFSDEIVEVEVDIFLSRLQRSPQACEPLKEATPPQRS